MQWNHRPDGRGEPTRTCLIRVLGSEHCSCYYQLLFGSALVYIACIAADQGGHGCTDFVASTAAVYSLALPCNGNQCLERRDPVYKTDPRKFLDRPAQTRFVILSCW
jgi:hypothetical protein